MSPGHPLRREQRDDRDRPDVSADTARTGGIDDPDKAVPEGEQGQSDDEQPPDDQPVDGIDVDIPGKRGRRF